MATGDEFKSHGITANTPKNILLGAGTIHKGLKCTTGTWNAEESIIAATSGGSTLTITSEVTDLEVDGANVKVKGLAVKTGETATLEVNWAELSPDVIKISALATAGSDEAATGYDVLTSKPSIEAGDYVENLGYVGKTVTGTPIIIIFPWALCTSGMEIGAEAKNSSKPTATFDCYRDITSDSLEHLGWKIYYPSAQTLDTLSATPDTTSATPAKASATK